MPGYFDQTKGAVLPLIFCVICSLAGCGDGQQGASDRGLPQVPSIHPPAGQASSEKPEKIFGFSALPSAAPAQVSPRGAPVLPVAATEMISVQAGSSEISNLPSDPNPVAAPPLKVKFKAGEDPAFAARKGWPVEGPAPLPGSILPTRRILAYYGNPLSGRMGVLGKYPKEEMFNRLREEMARWEAADPSLPVQPALHLIAVVAQGAPGKAGKYRMVMPDEIVEQVYGWAKELGALLFLDIQTGHEDIRTLLPRFEWILKNPDVHLGMDPEFNLISSKVVPGTKIGTYDAEDVNYVSAYLQQMVRKYSLPPKVLIVHRFTRPMLTNYRAVKLSPEVQIVLHMDGWGAPWLKRDSYRDYIVSEPVQFTGFKLFYQNDTKKGDPLMTPQEVLRLRPQPIYIQYQ